MTESVKNMLFQKTILSNKVTERPAKELQGIPAETVECFIDRTFSIKGSGFTGMDMGIDYRLPSLFYTNGKSTGIGGKIGFTFGGISYEEKHNQAPIVWGLTLGLTGEQTIYTGKKSRLTFELSSSTNVPLNSDIAVRINAGINFYINDQYYQAPLKYVFKLHGIFESFYPFKAETKFDNISNDYLAGAMLTVGFARFEEVKDIARWGSN